MNNLRIKTQFQLPQVSVNGKRVTLPKGFRWFSSPASDIVSSDNATYGDLVYLMLWAHFQHKVNKLYVSFATDDAGFRHDALKLEGDALVMVGEGRWDYRPYPSHRYVRHFLLDNYAHDAWQEGRLEDLYWSL